MDRAVFAIMAPFYALRRFLKFEASGGLALMFASFLALLFANTPVLKDAYKAFLHLPVVLGLGASSFEISLGHLINDGLMAVFFFLVALEKKLLKS